MSSVLEAFNKMAVSHEIMSEDLNNPTWEEEIDIVKLALERNEPKEPIEVQDKHFNCGNCGETISVGTGKKFNEFFNVHCVFCGQKQDWSDQDYDDDDWVEDSWNDDDWDTLECGCCGCSCDENEGGEMGMKKYENDLVTIYNGDCLECMNGLKVDKVITSPPYNIIRPNSTDRGYDVYKDGMSNEEYIRWNVDVFKKYDEILNPNGAIFYNLSYGTENTEAMSLVVAEIIKKTNFTLADVLVWKKKSATPNNVSPNKMTRIVEFVYVFCRRNEFHTFTANKKIVGQRKTGQKLYENLFNFFTSKNNDESVNINKANFSVDFVDNIIHRYVKKGDVVLDNFLGTGTTLVACIGHGIKAIGIELSQQQCDHAIERIKHGVNMRLEI